MDSGEFINLLFWNIYSLTKLAGFKFPAGHYCVQRFCGFGGVGIAAENAGEQRGVRSAGAFAWLLSGVKVSSTARSCASAALYDPLWDIPSALKDLPWQTSLQWVLQENCSVLETDGSAEHAGEVLGCSTNPVCRRDFVHRSERIPEWSGLEGTLGIILFCSLPWAGTPPGVPGCSGPRSAWP